MRTEGLAVLIGPLRTGAGAGVRHPPRVVVMGGQPIIMMMMAYGSTHVGGLHVTPPTHRGTSVGAAGGKPVAGLVHVPVTTFKDNQVDINRIIHTDLSSTAFELMLENSRETDH